MLFKNCLKVCELNNNKKKFYYFFLLKKREDFNKSFYRRLSKYRRRFLKRLRRIRYFFSIIFKKLFYKNLNFIKLNFKNNFLKISSKQLV